MRPAPALKSNTSRVRGYGASVRSIFWLPLVGLALVLAGCESLFSPPESDLAALCSGLEAAVLNAGSLGERRSAERAFAKECVDRNGTSDERAQKPSADPEAGGGNGGGGGDFEG